MLLLLLLSLLLVLAHFTTSPGGPARPATPVGENTTDNYCSCRSSDVNAHQGGGGPERVPQPLTLAPSSFIADSTFPFSLNYKARNGSLVPPRSYVAFLMINDRERFWPPSGNGVFVETRISKNTVSSFLPRLLSRLLHVHVPIYIYIFFLCVYIYNIYTLHIWDARARFKRKRLIGEILRRLGGGGLGRSREGGMAAEGRRLPFRKFNASNRFV